MSEVESAIPRDGRTSLRGSFERKCGFPSRRPAERCRNSELAREEKPYGDRIDDVTQQDSLRLQLRGNDHVVEAGEANESENRLRRHHPHQTTRSTLHIRLRIERFISFVDGRKEDLELASRIRPIVIHEDFLQRTFVLLGKGETNLENMVHFLSLLLALRHNIQHLLMITPRRILRCRFGRAYSWSTEAVASPSACNDLERVRALEFLTTDLDTPHLE